MFCKPSALQLRLYQHLLRSPLIRSCLSRGYASSASAGSPHLVCIGALKKLCNDPSLLYQASRKADEEGKRRGEESWLLDHDDEEVRIANTSLIHSICFSLNLHSDVSPTPLSLSVMKAFFEHLQVSVKEFLMVSGSKKFQEFVIEDKSARRFVRHMTLPFQAHLHIFNSKL